MTFTFASNRRNLESSRWSLQNFSYNIGHVTRKSVGLPLTFCSSDDKNNHKNEDTPSRPMYVYILREQGILLKDKLERPESDGLTLISTPLHVLPMWLLP